MWQWKISNISAVIMAVGCIISGQKRASGKDMCGKQRAMAEETATAVSIKRGAYTGMMKFVLKVKL